MSRRVAAFSQTLSGQPAINAWRDPNLHAVAKSGVALDQKHAQILSNKNGDYRREHPVALLSAADISDPNRVVNAGSTCWVKMSSESIDGLDIAFRSPETRVSDSNPVSHLGPVIANIGWEGGFLGGVTVPLNESLNVLIGGRGSGKSTVIESLRFVLDIDPVADGARNEHEAMVKSTEVLGRGTKVSVVLETRHPGHERYTIERTVPHSPVVRSAAGIVEDIAPRDLLGNIEIYGQRELAELTRDKAKLTTLLSKYLPDQDQSNAALRTIKGKLKNSRSAILDLLGEIESA